MHRRTTDLVRDGRSISRYAGSLDLMGVSSDREPDDVIQMHQKFQSLQAPIQMPMQVLTQPSIQSSEIVQQNSANEQMSQLTQILSQLNMNLVNSQMNSTGTQQSVEKIDHDQTQHSTQAERKIQQNKVHSKIEETIEKVQKKQPKTSTKSQSAKKQKGIK